MPVTTIYEQYTAEDGDDGLNATDWKSQTFQPLVTHVLYSIKFKGVRSVGAPGLMRASVKPTTAGVPSGADMCVFDFNANTLPTTPPTVTEIVMPTNPILFVGVRYAIVYRLVTPVGGNGVSFRLKGTAPAYPRGERFFKAHEADAWTASGLDFWFQELGYLPGQVKSNTRFKMVTGAFL